MLEQVLYRAHIVNYPEFEEYYAFDNQRPHVDDELWERPVGWVNTCPYSGAHALAIYTRYDTTTMGTKELDVKFPSGTGFPAHESEMEHWAALTAMKFMANVVHYGRK